MLVVQRVLFPEAGRLNGKFGHAGVSLGIFPVVAKESGAVCAWLRFRQTQAGMVPAST
jgi:hypothetical protein